MIPNAFVSHEVNGRLRFRIPSKRQDKKYFRKITKEFGKVGDIDRIRVEPLTGSVLVLHHGKSEEVKSQLARISREGHLFNLRKESNSGDHPLDQVFNRLERLDAHLLNATQGKWDLSGVIAVGISTLGFYQASRKQLFPPAFTLFENAILLLSGSYLKRKGKVRAGNVGVVLKTQA